MEVIFFLRHRASGSHDSVGCGEVFYCSILRTLVVMYLIEFPQPAPSVIFTNDGSIRINLNVNSLRKKIMYS